MRLLHLLPAAVVCASAKAFAAAPLDEAAQKKQLESLFNAVRPVAAEMVARKGEFHPFGASMDPDGKLGNVAALATDDHPKSAQLLAQLKASFRSAAKSNKIVASALVYDIRVTPPGKQDKTDAIAIDLDHRDGVSLTMICPYRIDADHQLIFGELLVQPGNHEIFRQGTP
jgi:hypothetical protein